MKRAKPIPEADFRCVKLELDPLLVFDAVDYHPLCGVFRQITLKYVTGTAKVVKFNLLSKPPVVNSLSPRRWTELGKGQTLLLDDVAVTGIVAWCDLEEWGTLEISTERWHKLETKA